MSLFHLIHATATDLQHAGVKTVLEHVAIVVVPQTVCFRLLVLEVNECRDSLRADPERADELRKFLLLSLERYQVLLVSRAEDYFQFFLLYLFLFLIHVLEISQFVLEPPHQTDFVDRTECAEKPFQLPLIHVIVMHSLHLDAELLWPEFVLLFGTNLPGVMSLPHKIKHQQC